MQDFEKLGVFYLGKIFDSAKSELTEDLLLYDSKDLTTHAVCVGMTGSGKTGLGIDILEEAAIDKIPAIIIDPKGDLTNLLLTFPHLSPEEFLPWIDKAEAERQGMDPKSYSESVAKTWKDGLAKWGETSQRIQNLKNTVDMVIYTPANKAGVPISILSSFAAPPKELSLDAGAFRDRVLSITSSLLGLIGITADPIKSREHILISTIIDQAWNKGIDLDIATIIQQVQKPPFTKVGVLDIDTFFPPKDRMSLSISLNNLLASPGFQAWMEGDPLDIQQLLYTKEGKPKLAILYIAHLSDTERMFFVTLLLNEVISWMRRQPGTSSLRAVLYMDEIFGYFPPTAAPPSKLPMMTLLKQARAFGLGIVLSTQNPVDLDYKGLSNCGTWFIGKLQTERDKSRVIEGLNIASNGELDSATLNKMIATTGSRNFIMRSVHHKDPLLFQSRWTMSYLRGPLTLSQIETLIEKTPISEKTIPVQAAIEKKVDSFEAKPLVPPGITEFFVNRPNLPSKYKPQILGLAKLHFLDSKNKVDSWQNLCIIAPITEDGLDVRWEEGKNYQDVRNNLEKNPIPESTFEQLPPGLAQEKNYANFEKMFTSFLYQNRTLNFYYCKELNLSSKENESEGDFRARITMALREKRDDLIKKIRDKYSDKMTSLTDKVRRAQEKLADTERKSFQQKTDTLISVGTTVLGALFGRGVTKGTISQAGTSIRRAGKIGQESQNASQAEENYKAYQQQLDDLQGQLNKEIDNLSSTADANNMSLDTIVVRPRKSDITIEKVALIWIPSKN